MTYTNELEVEIDFTDVDPNLLASTDDPSLTGTKVEDNGMKPDDENLPNSGVEDHKPKLNLGKDQPDTVRSNRADQFLMKQ